MKCIYCGEDKTGVANSGVSSNGNTCRRVICKSCGKRFYTIERAASQTDLDECRATLWSRNKSDSVKSKEN